jgi:tetratricopeptide (TPR) repeat protein
VDRIKGVIMLKVANRGSLFFIIIFLFIFLFPLESFCQHSAHIQKGINEYRDESYEEAIVTLTKARADEPGSSAAAFFLGMAYKQTMDYEKALINLLDAVNLTPRIKEALIEVVDVAMQLGKLDVAKHWVNIAEKEDIFPAKTAFLKGLILTEEGKTKEANESFAKAKAIDPKIAQAADLRIAIGYMKERELKEAKKSFEAAILSDPQSDLAGFARQYLAAVEQRISLERPLRFTIGVFGQYDDNMVLKPDDQAFTTGITNEGSAVLNTSFRVNYAPLLKSRWLFNAQYALGSSTHDKNRFTHDSISNSISVSPGYNFGSYAIYLATSYNHAFVRSPDFNEYSGSFSTGPLVRMSIKDTQLLEIFSGYSNTEYFKPALTPEEDRDAKGYKSYISFLWLLKKDYFLNLRVMSDIMDTDGKNWDNSIIGFSANYAMPVYNNIKLQLSGQISEQDFKHVHTVFGVKREDSIYSFSGGFSWNWESNSTVVIQYSRMRTDSNIGIYDYKRNIYTLGMEYRF